MTAKKKPRVRKPKQPLKPIAGSPEAYAKTLEDLVEVEKEAEDPAETIRRLNQENRELAAELRERRYENRAHAHFESLFDIIKHLARKERRFVRLEVKPRPDLVVDNTIMFECVLEVASGDGNTIYGASAKDPARALLVTLSRFADSENTPRHSTTNTAALFALIDSPWTVAAIQSNYIPKVLATEKGA